MLFWGSSGSRLRPSIGATLIKALACRSKPGTSGRSTILQQGGGAGQLNPITRDFLDQY